jgi:hypothetical protein
MSFAENLRIAIDSGLATYEAVGGSGADAYSPEPIPHPMADGKCLSLLDVLRRSNLLSATQFDARVAAVCHRLEEAALLPFDDGWCWGLGFSWRELPATEAFLITSALIVRGGLACLGEGTSSECLRRLLAQGMQGLSAWLRDLALPVGEVGLTIPAYSPGIRAPIYNAAACAYGTLRVGESVGWPSECASELLSSMGWIRSHRVAGLGWPYSPGSPVVDLLHQCYILNAMADVFGTPSVEVATAEMVGQFAGPCGFADVIHLRNAGELGVAVRDIPWLRPLSTGWIEVLPKPARLWSLGELLVVISRLGLEGDRADAWLRLGRRIAESILQHLSAGQNPEARYPRHVMHALHGLGCYLALLRERARQTSTTKLAVPGNRE